MDTAARNRHQERFIRDEADIIVATVAFGMGIDKSNVRYVIHYDLPRTSRVIIRRPAGRDATALKSERPYSTTAPETSSN